MIRINLLPVKQEKKREFGRQQIALFVFIIFVEVVLLFLVYNSKKEELDDIERAVSEARTQVAQVQEYQNRIAELDEQLRQLEADSRLHQSLQANRIGPGGPLQELKLVLNPWSTEREREEQRNRGWNVGSERTDSMDPQRVWLESLTVNPGGFQLRGVARSGSDVAEFLNRLDSSAAGEEAYFVRPELSTYSRTNDPYFGEVMQFSISGGVRYRPIALETN